MWLASIIVLMILLQLLFSFVLIYNCVAYLRSFGIFSLLPFYGWCVYNTLLLLKLVTSSPQVETGVLIFNLTGKFYCCVHPLRDSLVPIKWLVAGKTGTITNEYCIPLS